MFNSIPNTDHLPCKVISQCSNFKCLLVAAFHWPSFTNASFWIMGDLSLRELIKTRSSAKLCFALISICFFLLVPYFITLFPSSGCQFFTLYRFLFIWGMVFALNLKMSRGIGLLVWAVLRADRWSMAKWVKFFLGHR